MKPNKIRNNSNKFGKIIYSKSYYKNRIPSNDPPYNHNTNNPNIYDDSTQSYDNIINKAKRTIEEYKKQLNDEDFFNNEILDNNQIQNQLNNFNKGNTEFRFFSPYTSKYFNFIPQNNVNNKGVKSQ